MDMYSDRSADFEMIKLLQAASHMLGLPVADVEALINSDLETDYLVVYINAMMSDRMN